MVPCAGVVRRFQTRVHLDASPILHLGEIPASCAALGGTAHELITAIDAKYHEARQLGHTVIPLIHDVFGAVHHEARQCIVDTSDRTRGWNMRRRDSSVPWSAPTLKPWMQQSISMALHRAVAEQILQGASYEKARLDGELEL